MLDAGQDFSVFGSPAPEPKQSDLILVAISRVDDLKVAEGLDGLGPDRERNILLVDDDAAAHGHAGRSEEHTSELQSLMRISYAVFCLKKKTKTHRNITQPNPNQSTKRMHSHNNYNTTHE